MPQVPTKERGSAPARSQPPPSGGNAFAPRHIDPLTGLAPLAPGGFDAKLPTGAARRAAARTAAQQALIKRHNDAIIAARQAAATQRVTLATTAAKLGLPADISRPFAGEGGPVAHPGAKDVYQPDLTAKANLAAANALRMLHGGLLTPAQIKQESAAKAQITHSAAPTFADKYQGVLGTLADLWQAAPPAPQPTSGPGAPETYEHGPAVTPNPKGLKPGDVGWFASMEPKGTYGSGTASFAGMLGSTRFPDWIGRNINAVNLAAGIGKQTERLRPSVGNIPHQAVDATGFNDAVQAAIIKANGGKLPAKVDLAETIAKYGNGALGAQMRQFLTGRAKTNGWPVQDVKSWTDADLAARAFNKMSYSLGGFLQNAAADSGTLAALVTAPVQFGQAIGDSIVKRSLTPIARTGGQLADQWGKHLIGFGDRPFYENAYEQPFTTLTSNTPLLKGAGEGIGRALRLDPTREITLPTTGHTIEVPHTRDVFTRPLARASDALLARATHPHDRTRPDESLTGAAGIAADLRSALRHPEQAIGHRIERGHDRRHGEQARLEAQLGTNREARHAINRYIDAIRRLPTTRADLLGRSVKIGEKGAQSKLSSKQTRAEAIIYHHALGTSSHELAPYYEGLAKATEGHAADLTAQAATLREEAQAAQASGDNAYAEELGHRASDVEGQAQAAHDTAAAQAAHAAYSHDNPVDVHNATPEERRLVEAAREVSRVATGLKGQAGELGPVGALYGDLQHRLHIVAASDGPGSAEARALLGHRDEMLKVEQVLAEGKVSNPSTPASQRALATVRALRPHLRDIGARRVAVAARRAKRLERLKAASGTPAPAVPSSRTISTHERIGEARSAAAAHEAANPGVTTRIETKKIPGTPGTPAAIHWKNEGSTHTTASDARRAAKTYEKRNPAYETQVVAGKGGGHQLQVRKAAKAATKARPEHSVIATTPGAHPRRVGVKSSNAERIAAAAESQAQRAGAAKGTVRRIIDASAAALKAKQERHIAQHIAPAEKALSTLEGAERAAHEKVAGADLKRAQAALRAAQVAKRAPEVLHDLETQVAHAQGALDKGFMESDKLVAARAAVVREQAALADVALKPSEIDEISARHLKPAEAKAVSRVVLHDAVNEAIYHGADSELGRLEERIRAHHDEAQAKYEALSGSRADLAVAHGEMTDRYASLLHDFRESQSAEGRDPFHIALRAPGQGHNDPVTRTGNRQFQTGWYTHDVHIALASDLEGAARTSAETELFRRISDSPYVITAPPPGGVIPPGFALVRKAVLDSVVKPHYTAEENLALINEWQAKTARPRPGERVPFEGGPHVLISKNMLDWLKDELSYRHNQTSPGMQKALDFTNAYRRWMLFTLPRTLINNAVGNPILAAMGGAGIMDYIRSYHMLKQHPELVMHTLRHRGPIANFLETNKLTGWQAWFRDKNVFHEDLGRLTVFMHHVIRDARHDQGLKFYQRIDMASEQMTKLLHDIANGEHPKIGEYNKFADEWFGNMAKRGRWDKALSLGILFHRWVGHMVRLTLATMPLKYPGRTALMLNLSHMADDYRKEHGIYPDWAKGVVGLWDTRDKTGQGPQGVTWGLGTTGFFPLATSAQSIDLGNVGQAKSPLLTAAAANLNPGARILIEQMLGARLDTLQPFTDPAGNPAGQFNPDVFLNQVGAATPILNSVFTRTGQADTYRPLIDDVLGRDTRRYSAAGVSDPTMRSPSPPHFGLWGILSRVAGAAGVPIRPIDSGAGARTTLAANKSLLRTYQLWHKQAAKAAVAAEAKKP